MAKAKVQGDHVVVTELHRVVAGGRLRVFRPGQRLDLETARAHGLIEPEKKREPAPIRPAPEAPVEPSVAVPEEPMVAVPPRPQTAKFPSPSKRVRGPKKARA